MTELINTYWTCFKANSDSICHSSCTVLFNYSIIKEYHSNVEVLRNPVLEHYTGNEPDGLTYRHIERPSSWLSSV